MIKNILAGTAHKLPKDLREALTCEPKALLIWENLTPLARNEWICWVTFVKQDKTRKERIIRNVTGLSI